MRVGIVGSRNVSKINFLKFLSYIPFECTEIVSGGAVGIDNLAEIASNYLNIKIKIFYPDYKKWGRKAPILRNYDIVLNSDIVLAFWDMKSRGTKSSINICKKYNIPYKIIDLSDIE